MTTLNPLSSLDRIVIIGSAGAGKSTLAANLSRATNLPTIELDDLNWLPHWTQRSTEDFRARVDSATQPDKWVVAGNYGSCRDILWPRAQAIVWLDYSFGRVMRQLLIRTFKRWWTREELFGSGNTEQLSKIFSRDSLIWWAIKTWPRRQREYPLAFAQPEHQHLHVYRLSHPSQARELVKIAESSYIDQERTDSPVG